MILPHKAIKTSNDGHLGIHQDPQACSAGWSPVHVDAQGFLFHLRYKTLPFSLLTFMKFLSTKFSGSSRDESSSIQYANSLSPWI